MIRVGFGIHAYLKITRKAELVVNHTTKTAGDDLRVCHSYGNGIDAILPWLITKGPAIIGTLVNFAAFRHGKSSLPPWFCIFGSRIDTIDRTN